MLFILFIYLSKAMQVRDQKVAENKLKACNAQQHTVRG